MTVKRRRGVRVLTMWYWSISVHQLPLHRLARYILWGLFDQNLTSQFPVILPTWHTLIPRIMVGVIIAEKKPLSLSQGGLQNVLHIL